MFIILNAYRSIIRSKGRNILIGIIVLAIAASSSIALAIRSAAEAARESGLSAQTITGTISVDRQRLMGGFGNGREASDPRELLRRYSGLSLQEMQAYAISDYIKDFYYSASTYLNAGGEIEPFSTEDTSDNSGSQGGRPGFNGGGRGAGFGGMALGDFSVVGYSSENAMTRFASGESQIIEGTLFDPGLEDYKCLISRELALINGLSVGDSLNLVNPGKEDEAYAFTIAGIYTNTGADSAGAHLFGTAADPANLICVSFGTLQNLAESSSKGALLETDENGRERTTALSLQTSGTYQFAGKAEFDNFTEELKQKGLPEYYTLSSPDLNSYEESLIPLENLSSFAATLLALILAVGALILIVLNIFNVRERKYEVGVLTAIGIKKPKVAAQFVLELLMVSLIAISIGAGLGAALSEPVSNHLLQSQIQAQESAQSMRERYFGRPGTGNRMPGESTGSVFRNPGTPAGSIDYPETVNADVNPKIFIELVGIGILLTIISSSAGIVFVLRYDPLEILANRA